MPSSAVAARDLVAQRVRREALRQRPGRDREGDVAHLGPLLDEPRHRAAAAELAVVGVRGEDERALPAAGHGAPRGTTTEEEAGWPAAVT